MTSSTNKLKQHMLGNNFTPPEGLTFDGRIKRFYNKGDKKNTKNGWFIGRESNDLRLAIYGSWKSGKRFHWCSKDNLDEDEKIALKKFKREFSQELGHERKHKYSEVQKKATLIWSKSHKPDKNHPYLSAKKVKPFNSRQSDDDLIIPIYNQNGEICNVQKIDPKGTKKFLSGGKKQACYSVIGKYDGVVCISEGWATGASIHQATGHLTLIALDAGNLVSVAKVARNQYPYSKIIICADNDANNLSNTGLSKATEAAKEVGAYLAVPSFIGDFNDPYSCKELNITDPDKCIKVATKKAVLQKRDFQAYTVSEIQSLPRVRSLIGGMLSSNGLSVVYGEPGSGKTFFAIDVAMHIANDIPWRDKKTAQGAVLYIATEGVEGIRDRSAAYLYSNQLPDIGTFLILPKQIDMITSSLHTEKIIEEVKKIEEADLKVRLIIIDTLSRAMASGNENASETMGAVIKHADMLRENLKLHVMIVHHSGKQKNNGMRGHSSLFGAIDTGIYIKKQGDLITSEVFKQRDYKINDPLYFRLKSVKIASNSNKTSCVLAPVAELPRKSELSAKTSAFYAMTLDLLKKAGSTQNAAGSPVDRISITIKSLRDEYRKTCSDNVRIDTLSKQFRRLLISLRDAKRIDFDKNYVWLYPENKS